MTALKHQVVTAEKLWTVIKRGGYALLLGEIRSGKSLTAILTVEKSKRVKNVLILTKKAAIGGLIKFTEDAELDLQKNYTVTNYEAVGRIVDRTHSKQGKKLKKPIPEIVFKLNPDDYDVLIFDEMHSLGKIGKPTKKYQILKAFTGDKPWIGMTGTFGVETMNAAYYACSLSTKTPFKQDNFYRFFDEFGVPSTLKLGNREVAQYHRYKPTLPAYIETFSVRMTQTDAGISDRAKSEVKLHYINLTAETRTLYNKLQTDKVIKVQGKQLIADSIMKLRMSLYAMEGGTVKVGEEYIILGNTEKIDYIKNNFNLDEQVGIMCHYIGEQNLLKTAFPNAEIYSSTAHAEGVNLSHLDHFIIYSEGPSGAKHIQREDRCVNIDKKHSTTVHYLLVKHALSEQTYECTSKKKDFNNKTYKQKEL